MPNTLADRFIQALGQLEANSDPEPLATLFAPKAEVGNVLAPDKFHGPAGAREFWTKYRSTFGTLKSTFRNTIIGENRVALEWVTEGTFTHGSPVAYDGVSILELEGDKIIRFEAYFDPAALGRQMETADAKAAAK